MDGENMENGITETGIVFLFLKYSVTSTTIGVKQIHTPTASKMTGEELLRYF